MSGECDGCPAKGYCRRLPAYCAWAAGDPPDPRKLDHIREASGRALRAGYPPLRTQARNVLAAAGRLAATIVTGRAVLVPPEVLAERSALCMACDYNAHRDTGGIRCMKCGCTGAKTRLATEACPIGKWGRWGPPADDEAAG